MKKLFLGIVMILMFVLIQTSNAQENQTQLWYCWEEEVHPNHVYEFMEANKELAKICKEINYGSTYYAWTTGDFKYQFWHPINSLADIDKVEAEWKRVIERYGKEKDAAYQKMIKSYHSKTATEIMGLGHYPANPRVAGEDVKYMEFQEFYIVPGKEAEFGKLMKEAIAYLKENGYNDTWHVASGGLGYNGPVYIGWSVDSSKANYMANDEEFGKKYGEYFQEFNKKFVKTFRTAQRSDAWYLEDISYISEN